MVKNLPAKGGDIRDKSLIPGLGRSPGERKGYSLQYSGLENSMDYSPWGCKESDMTEQHFLQQFLTNIDLYLKIRPNL